MWLPYYTMVCSRPRGRGYLWSKTTTTISSKAFSFIRLLRRISEQRHSSTSLPWNESNKSMEDGSRFGHFWWFYARVYYVYILVDQPYSDRNLMVLWAKAPVFKARHFAVLWFDPQSSNIFFRKINFSFTIFLCFNL